MDAFVLFVVQQACMTLYCKSVMYCKAYVLRTSKQLPPYRRLALRAFLHYQ